ncbi:hypothetical protein BDC45DRAFT_536459 [Circinella umbellata]|nr:hypothetical protein BDC45DRAFT_536459 [Circinella umbellata]
MTLNNDTIITSTIFYLFIQSDNIQFNIFNNGYRIKAFNADVNNTNRSCIQDISPSISYIRKRQHSLIAVLLIHAKEEKESFKHLKNEFQVSIKVKNIKTWGDWKKLVSNRNSQNKVDGKNIFYKYPEHSFYPPHHATVFSPSMLAYTLS